MTHEKVEKTDYNKDDMYNVFCADLQIVPNA